MTLDDVAAIASDVDDRLGREIRLILELDRLKSVERRTIVTDGWRRENTAEHSWHLAMMALILARGRDDVDVARVVELVLVHDIVEIDAGDTFLYDEAGKATKRAREELAAERIFALGPPDVAAWLHERWQEYEDAATPEAAFAHVVDRLAPLLLNASSRGVSWRAHGIRRHQVETANAGIGAESARLGSFVKALLDHATANRSLPD